MGAETEVPWITAHASTQSMGSGDVSESEFPAGLRVLVVDDDRICLLILDRLLQQCSYKVTTCERAVDALKILRDRKDGFDVVISDVHMPDMDGYKLLELVGLEMDLPVIMMSSNSETSAVMKGIKHGACDYLLKPVRIEELKNIWQHVIRRKKKDPDSDERSRPDDGTDQLAHDGTDGALKSTKRRKDNSEEEDDLETESDDPATSKKPRVVWSVDLHQKFVNAVNSLGIDKAVPKRILELMDVKGLTRENVASHLQKYRLYLKRISGTAYQGAGGYFTTADERFLSTGGGLVADFRSRLPSHALVSSLQSGLLDRICSPNEAMDSIFLGQLANMQGLNRGLVMQKPPFAAPLLSSAHDLNRGLNTKHPGHGLGEHVSSHVHNDRLSDFTLSSSPRHMDQLTGQENHILSDNRSSNLVMRILQNQRNASQVTSGVLPETHRGNAHYLESSSVLSKANNSLSGHDSSCRSSPEMATLAIYSAYEPTTGLGPYRKKGVHVGTHNNVPEVEFTTYTASSKSRLLSQSMLHDVELSTSKDGLLTGLHSVLADQAGGTAPFRAGASSMNTWQGWNQDLDVGRQGGLSLISSSPNQGSATLAQGSTLGYSQEPKLGWIPNLQSQLVDDIEVKPLANCAHPAFERGIGEKEVLKGASLEALLVSQVTEPFPSSDDLLSCYMKQQQQEMASLSESTDAADGFTPGNMYVKEDGQWNHTR